MGEHGFVIAGELIQQHSKFVSYIKPIGREFGHLFAKLEGGLPLEFDFKQFGFEEHRLQIALKSLFSLLNPGGIVCA